MQWTASFGGLIDIQHDYFFDDSDERINIQTTLTALQDLTGVLLSRAMDPDPDVNRFNLFSTNNQRGLDANTDGDFDDAGDTRREDFTGAIGTQSGQTIAIFFDRRNPAQHGNLRNLLLRDRSDFYLNGGNLGDSSTGDDGIGIGFNIGYLLSGDTAVINYAWVMVGTLEIVDSGDDDGTVPVLTTLALLGVGLLGVGVTRKKSRQS